MKNVSESKKEEIFWAVFSTVIKLDLLRGYLQWTHSELSRQSKVHRTLIYYYFGKSKEEILSAAVDYLGKEYFGLNEERLDLWKQNQIFESIHRSRVLWKKSSYVYSFYILRREQDNIAGQKLRELESLYEKKLRSFLPHLSQELFDAVQAILFGLAVSPRLSDEGLKTSFQLVQSHLGENS